MAATSGLDSASEEVWQDKERYKKMTAAAMKKSLLDESLFVELFNSLRINLVSFALARGIPVDFLLLADIAVVTNR